MNILHLIDIMNIMIDHLYSEHLARQLITFCDSGEQSLNLLCSLMLYNLVVNDLLACVMSDHFSTPCVPYSQSYHHTNIYGVYSDNVKSCEAIMFPH